MEQSGMQTPNRRKMFVFLMVLAVIILAVGVGWYLSQPKTQGQRDLATDFSLTDLEGNSFRLSDFRGKVVVLDFMATWCGACRTQIPHLNVVWEKEEYRDKIVLMSIDIDPRESGDTLRSFAQGFPDATWIWAGDTANLAQAYEVVYIPKTVIVDTEGYVGFTHTGVVDASVLIQEIDQLLS